MSICINVVHEKPRQSLVRWSLGVIARVQDGKAKLAAILAELLYNPTE